MTRRDDGLDQLEEGQVNVLSPGADGAGPAAWRDAGRPAEERVADLLRRMTLAEKVGQLTSTWPSSASGTARVAPLHEELAGTPAVSTKW